MKPHDLFSKTFHWIGSLACTTYLTRIRTPPMLGRVGLERCIQLVRIRENYGRRMTDSVVAIMLLFLHPNSCDTHVMNFSRTCARVHFTTNRTFLSEMWLAVHYCSGEACIEHRVATTCPVKGAVQAVMLLYPRLLLTDLVRLQQQECAAVSAIISTILVKHKLWITSSFAVQHAGSSSSIETFRSIPDASFFI